MNTVSSLNLPVEGYQIVAKDDGIFGCAIQLIGPGDEEISVYRDPDKYVLRPGWTEIDITSIIDKLASMKAVRIIGETTHDLVEQAVRLLLLPQKPEKKD